MKTYLTLEEYQVRQKELNKIVEEDIKHTSYVHFTKTELEIMKLEYYAFVPMIQDNRLIYLIPNALLGKI